MIRVGVLWQNFAVQFWRIGSSLVSFCCCKSFSDAAEFRVMFWCISFGPSPRSSHASEGTKRVSFRLSLVMLKYTKSFFYFSSLDHVF